MCSQRRDRNWLCAVRTNNYIIHTIDSVNIPGTHQKAKHAVAEGRQKVQELLTDIDTLSKLSPRGFINSNQCQTSITSVITFTCVPAMLNLKDQWMYLTG